MKPQMDTDERRLGQGNHAWSCVSRWLRPLLLVLAVSATVKAADNSYRASIAQWQHEREARLKADDGWLTLAGLSWLKEGFNTFGSDPGNRIVLPTGSAAGRAGVFEFHGGKTVIRMEGGAHATLAGKTVTTQELRPDQPGPADVVALGDLTLQVIERGGRYGIRVKDKNSKVRKEFAGLKSFPVNEAWRVEARFVPYTPPKVLAIPTVLGDVEKSPSPGYAAFTLHGHEYRLDPILDDDGHSLFFIFRDLTTGKETYPAGRFLDADPPKDGKVVLDFNKAYNPPCAFTPYATCPLPPPQNALALRIEAGELRYH